MKRLLPFAALLLILITFFFDAVFPPNAVAKKGTNTGLNDRYNNDDDDDDDDDKDDDDDDDKDDDDDDDKDDDDDDDKDDDDDDDDDAPETLSTGYGKLILGGPGVGNNFRTVVSSDFGVITDLGRCFQFEFVGIEAQADADGVLGAYSYDGEMWEEPKSRNDQDDDASYGYGSDDDDDDDDDKDDDDDDDKDDDDDDDKDDDDDDDKDDDDDDDKDDDDDDDKDDDDDDDKDDDDDDDKDDDDDDDKDDDDDDDSDDGDTDEDGRAFGWWKMRATVNDHSIGDLRFRSSKLHEMSPLLRKTFASPIVFHQQNIRLEWHGEGNSNDPDGHFHILGSIIKEPPVPRGELDILQTYYSDGAKPHYGWDIDRD